MPEIRQTLPYVSHLRVTKRPTRKLVPSGYQDQAGQELYKQIADLPGIECEITPYMGSVKGPATQFRFPSKAFFEDALAELQAMPVSEQTTKSIGEIETTLARTDVHWAESVLLSKGLPPLDVLWESVFSDALDEFSQFEEQAVPFAGVPVTLKEMQWDARIPADGAKSIELKIGMFSDTTPEPTITTLSFEDSATMKQREAYSAQLQARIDQVTAEIAKLPEGSSIARTQQEATLAQYVIEKAQRDAVEVGSLISLVANPSVQASLPLLLLAIIETAYPGIDMAIVQERLGAALAGLA